MPAPSFDPISLATKSVATNMQQALGLLQVIQAGKQNREAKKLSRNLIRPDYEIPQEYLDNEAFAESKAAQGMSDAARSVYEANANRTLNSSINAILRGGGSVNNISDLYGTAESNFASLAALEDEMRLKREKVYMDTNEDLANQKTTQWQVNQYAPYQDQKQLIASLRKQAMDNKWKGFNTIASSVANFAGMMPIDSQISSGETPAAAPAATRYTQAGIAPSGNAAGGSDYGDIYSQEMLRRVGKNMFNQ